MIFNKQELLKKCNDLLIDIEKGKMSSPAWLWMAFGAGLGLLGSCVKTKRKEARSVLVKLNKEDEL